MNGTTLIIIAIIWIALYVIARWRYHANDVAHRYDWDILAAGSLFALTIGFFWRTVSGDVFQPADGGDLVSFLYPTYRFAAAQLANGTLPLWNPTLYGGAPFISDIQAGFLYPVNLFLFLINPDFPYVTLQWMPILHIYWTGLGVYVLLRTLRIADAPLMRGAALFGAIAFQFSDPLLIHFGNLNLIAVLSWMPWIFAAYAAALEGRKLWLAALAGLLFAVSTYAGHAQSTLYIGLALVVFTLLEALLDSGAAKERAGVGAAAWEYVKLALRNYAVPLMVTVAAAIVLSAPILLPAMQLTGHTERVDFSYQETVDYSLAPTQALGLITPGFFGRGPALHWSLWQRVELPYAGVATLLMAIGALLLASAHVRRRLWPWFGLGAFGLLTAFGIYAILHGWLTALLPTFAQFRAPARALVLWTFAVSIAGALGVDIIARRGLAVLDSTSRPDAFRGLLRAGALILAGVALPLTYFALFLTQDSETAYLRASLAALSLTLAAAFWLATWALVSARESGWFASNTFVLLMVALLFLDLSATGAYTDISEQDPTIGFQQEEIIAYLQAQPDLFRIDSLTGIESLWQPDIAALYGLQDLGGVANPLSLSVYHELLDATGGRDSQLYDMLNAEYVIVQDGTPLPEGKFELALDAQGALSVYRNLNAMPRAWMVYQATLAANDEQAQAMIQESGFDPSREAVIMADAMPALTANAAGTIKLVDYASSKMTYSVESEGDGLLILSEFWYPGWRATINGQPASVLSANGGLRAVPVPAGDSTVVLQFRPRTWRIGLGLAAIGVLVLIGWAIIAWYLRRRK